MSALVAILVALALQGGSAMRVIEKGDQSNVDEPRQVVARTAAEWAALWRQHAPDRPQPKVDLTSEMVVGLFLGSRPSSGFAIEAAGTRQEQGALVVQYRESSPPPGLLSAQVLTFAYSIVAVPRHAGEVRFEKVDGKR
jgi:hypothetical protein